MHSMEGSVRELSVERMKYVNIVAGPISVFDDFIIRYIIDQDMQMEHALSAIHNIRGLKPFTEENPYDLLIKKVENINRDMKVQVTACQKHEPGSFSQKPLEIEAAMEYLTRLEEKLNSLENAIKDMQSQVIENQQILKQLIPIKNLKLDINELFNLEYMKFRFGKLPKESYRKMDMVIEGLDIIVLPFASDDDDIWISYFMPPAISEKIDSVMSTLFFERVRISEKAKGYPAVAISAVEKEIERLEGNISLSRKSHEDILKEEKEKFQGIYNQVSYIQQAYHVRKFAAHTQETFFIVGWMPEKAYHDLSICLKEQKDITFLAEEPEILKGLNPPTILKNNRFFKPFESIVTMYGIPSHNEFDPTVLVAITYILMFGAMFGDVGQGILLALAGVFMYFGRKSPLGWVLACIGVSSTVFGFLYGSFFGNEHFIRPLWKAPMDNINQLLIMSIGYGAGIILLSIVISIINSIKARDYGRLLFDKNGVAGLIFYCGAIGMAISMIQSGNFHVSVPVILLLLVLPLLLMLFRERLERIILKHNRHAEGGSFVEGFFEVFEAVLGFLSNTVSFVRVSAFALSHAGLALAVWTLYEMVNGAAGRVAVIIIGNALIIGLEGLIVGIQCLRLQYYEMFSRFFSGDGRRFQPIRICGKDRE